MIITNELLIKLIILFLVFSMFKKNIPYILNFMRGKPLKEEDAPDILRLIYKKRKKAARWNKRKITKRILCEGDIEVSPITYRQSGILYNTGCVEVFWKPNFFHPGQWTFIPTKLILDFHSRSMRIKCRGFVPLGENVWIPEFTIPESRNEHLYMEQIINHFANIINMEGATIQQHLRINTISTASLTKVINSMGLRQAEALPRIGEDAEGAEQ